MPEPDDRVDEPLLGSPTAMIEAGATEADIDALSAHS
jgi:hypothetical protein